jgi:ParB family chromosome partitioning protein
MAQAAQKLVLSSSRDIPFNKLILSQSNVRRIQAGVSIEELAEDVGRRGLIQSLNVRPVLDGEGQETGMFEVPAGGRRYRALELLVKRKRLARTAPVPCVVRDGSDGITAEEDSLAENVQRIDLHPLDQYRAFQRFVEQGQGIEEIAARFFVTPVFVRQRLRLAAVSPKLLDVYAADEMTLEQLMAFTVTGDHARQEQVWENLQRSYNKDAYYIRKLLTESTVEASDRRAVFVGVEAYERACGVVLRDLFQADRGGWLQDVALLDRMVVEKLAADAEAIVAEGWKWIEAAVDLPYGVANGLRRIRATGPVLTDEEQERYDALQTEFGTIEEQYSDSPDVLPEDVDRRLGEIEAALDEFHNRPVEFDPAELARAGVFVTIDRDGALKVERGFVRPEDEAPIAPVEASGGDGDPVDGETPTSDELNRPTVTVTGLTPPEPAEEDEGVKPLPEQLMKELTAHRTLALRDAVASQPRVAMTLLLHKLVADQFRRGSQGACLEASIRSVYFSAQAADLKTSSSAANVDERQKSWAERLPDGEDQVLWDWIDRLGDDDRAALLAHCVSFGVNALFEKVDRYGGAGLSQHGLDRRFAEADRLAAATGLDLAEAGWTPTVDNYLGRVTKGRILEAVREAKGEQPAQLIDHLKKGEMAKEAERLLADTGWLPEVLRTPGDEEPEADPAMADEPDGGEVAALPAFLNDLDGADETAEPPAIAAE